MNCVQCHPFDCTVATSGIDNTIKVSDENNLFECTSQVKELTSEKCMVLDMDSKCSYPIHCSWGSCRTRDSRCVGSYGEQSTEIMPKP